MATEGFDAAAAAVQNSNLLHSLRGSGAEVNPMAANPMNNAAAIIQHATKLKDIDYLQAISTQGFGSMLGANREGLFAKPKKGLGKLLEGHLTFEWTPHIENVHGTMPDTTVHIQAVEIQAPPISEPGHGR